MSRLIKQNLAAIPDKRTSKILGAVYDITTPAVSAVTQATNRTTGVTVTTAAGAITTNNASLAAETSAKFTVTCAKVAIGDVPLVVIRSGSNGGNTSVSVAGVAAGSFDIQVSNDNAAAGTAETGAIVINYTVVKVSASA